MKKRFKVYKKKNNYLAVDTEKKVKTLELFVTRFDMQLVCDMLNSVAEETTKIEPVED